MSQLQAIISELSSEAHGCDRERREISFREGLAPSQGVVDDLAAVALARAFETRYLGSPLPCRVTRAKALPRTYTKASRKQQIIVQNAIYGLRNRIERLFNRLKIRGGLPPVIANSFRPSQLSSCSPPCESGSNLSTRLSLPRLRKSEILRFQTFQPKNRIWPVPVWRRIGHFHWDDPGSTAYRRSPHG